jgi:Flp pilus assembly pilin Flp
MTNNFLRVVSDEDGQDLIEYGLIAGFISVVCYLAIVATGKSISTLWTSIRDKVIAAEGLM